MGIIRITPKLTKLRNEIDKYISNRTTNLNGSLKNYFKSSYASIKILIRTFFIRREIQKSLSDKHISDDKFKFMLHYCRNIRDLLLFYVARKTKVKNIPYYFDSFSLEWLDETVLELEIATNKEINRLGREIVQYIDKNKEVDSLFSDEVTNKGVGYKSIKEDDK